MRFRSLGAKLSRRALPAVAPQNSSAFSVSSKTKSDELNQRITALFAGFGLRLKSIHITIEYNSKDKAIGWRDVGRDKPEGWHRDNVVLVNNPSGQPLLVVPKKKAKLKATEKG